ncbi:MAG: hypothetical protein JRI25_12210 [Deltaproteobacteria bacterium]|nr:hypothetical protein [Deltaproteobacteria bacterium]
MRSEPKKEREAYQDGYARGFVDGVTLEREETEEEEVLPLSEDFVEPEVTYVDDDGR